MSDFEGRLAKDLEQGREYRDAYAEAFGNEYLANQIRILRKQRGLTQDELGKRIGSNQGRISVYEDDEYGKWSLDTLRKLASEFGLWLKISLESYGLLIHEASNFSPERLTRDAFENDREVLRWLERDEAVGHGDRARRIVSRWASAEYPDRATLAGWLEGRGLPGFHAFESTPVQFLLETIPPSDEGTWTAIVNVLASLLSADPNELLSLLADPVVYNENAFGLARAIGPRAELQESLDLVYRREAAAYEQTGNAGLGRESAAELVTAMIHNQVDARRHDLWRRYLTQGEHPFLPGKASMGMRGLLGMPGDQEYWRRIVQGIRDVEQRFLLAGKAGVKDEPNILDELRKIVGVAFNWWNEPVAAQRMLQASMDLMGAQTWSFYALAAWAAEIVEREGWYETAWTSNDVQKKRFEDCMATGLTWYSDWQMARAIPVQDEIRRVERISRQRALPVAG